MGRKLHGRQLPALYSREKVATHPVTGMRGQGTFNLPAGSWTDDSSLTLALLDSIGRTGKMDLKDIMRPG